METEEVARSGVGAVATDLQARARYGGIRLLMVHPQDLMLVGCRAVFGRQQWVSRCLVARELATAVDLARRYEPHLVIIHVGAASSAAELCRAIRGAHPPARLLLMTEPGRLTDADARCAGAMGVAQSTVQAAGLVEIARRLTSGRRMPARSEEHTGLRLSARERQVLSHMATGATNREISRQLVLSPDTVKNHVSRSFRKLGASNRLQAVNRARDLGLLG